jgi:hypothetical protein
MKESKELYTLYPRVSTRTDNLDHLAENMPVIKRESKLTFVHILSLAIFLTMTVVILMLFYNFLNQTVDINNIVGIISGVILSLMLWFGVLIFILVITLTRLDSTGINKILFLAMYALSALPILQLTYNLFNHFNHGVINLISFSETLFFENLVFVTLILKIIGSRKLSDQTKNILLISIIILCIFATSIGSIYL